MKILLDISGWLGSALILLSYALTLNKARDYSTAGRYMNLAGGVMIAGNCFYYNALPSFVTNIVWSLIALLSIYRARKHFLRA
ncbi:MAG: hypothetical protein WBB45_16310 [Cyclobacteriaceae bacterium]